MYHKDNFSIFYQDETWIFKNTTSSKIWREPDNIEAEKVFAVSFGRGKCSILCHVGSKDVDLLDGFMLLLQGSKSSKSSGYYNEMN